MEKTIKIVLVFALIFSIVIIWVGIKSRQGDLFGKGKAKVSPSAKKTIITPEEFEKMDLIAEDLAWRKEAAALIVDPLEKEFLEELIPEEPLPPEAVDWFPEAVDLPPTEDNLRPLRLN